MFPASTLRKRASESEPSSEEDAESASGTDAAEVQAQYAENFQIFEIKGDMSFMEKGGHIFFIVLF